MAARCQFCPVDPRCPERSGFGSDAPQNPHTCEKRVDRFAGLQFTNTQLFIIALTSGALIQPIIERFAEVDPTTFEKSPVFSVYHDQLEGFEIYDSGGNMVGFEHPNGDLDYFNNTNTVICH